MNLATNAFHKMKVCQVNGGSHCMSIAVCLLCEANAVCFSHRRSQQCSHVLDGHSSFC